MGLGQFSGSRGKYTYTSDTGAKYYLTLDEDLVIVGSGLSPYDPATDVGYTPPPKRFKPRVVFWRATGAGFVGKRKALVAGIATDDLYSFDGPQTFSVDGVAGITTGRRGEKITF